MPGGLVQLGLLKDTVFFDHCFGHLIAIDVILKRLRPFRDHSRRRQKEEIAMQGITSFGDDEGEEYYNDSREEKCENIAKDLKDTVTRMFSCRSIFRLQSTRPG